MEIYVCQTVYMRLSTVRDSAELVVLDIIFCEIKISVEP